MTTILGWRAVAIVLLLLADLRISSAQDTFSLINRWANGRTHAIASNAEYYFLGNGGLFIAFTLSGNEFVEEGRFMVEGVVREIAVHSNIAYVIDDLGNMYIVDVSQIGNIELLHKLEFVGAIDELVAEDEFIYLISSSTFYPVDVSDPSDPQWGQSLRIPSQGTSIAINDTLAYLGTSETGVQIVNLSTRDSPQLIGEVRHDPQSGLSFSSVHDIAIRDSVAYLAADRAGLIRLDISKPAEPSYLDRFDSCTSIQDCDYIEMVDLSDEHVVVSGARHDLRILSNNSSLFPPTLVSTINWKSEYINLINVADMLIQNSRVLAVTDEIPGLRLIDISSGSQPQEQASFDFGGDTAFGLELVDSELFVASGRTGLRVLDVSDLENIDEIGSYRPDEELLTADGVRNVIFNGDKILAVGDGFYILEMNSFGEIDEIGAIRDEIPRGIFELSDMIALDDDCVFVRAGRNGIRVYDMSDPSFPILLNELSSLSEGFYYRAPYLTNVFREGIVTFDISNKTEPILGEVVFNSIPNYAVTQDNEIIYLLAGDGLRIFEGSDPHNLIELGYLPLYLIESGGQLIIERMVLDSEVLYIAAGRQGLILIDVSDKENPVEIGRYDTPHVVLDVAVDGSTIFLADGFGGVHILERKIETTGEWNNPFKQISEPRIHPNPGEGMTTVSFGISRPGTVIINVFDSLGRRVTSMKSRLLSRIGEHQIQWDSSDLLPGIYFIHVQTEEDARTARFVKGN